MDFGYVNPSPVLRDHIQSIPARQKIEPVAQTFADVRKLATVEDDFLRGFNEGYEENAIATAPESRDPNFWDLTVNSFKYGYNDSARGQEAWKSMHGQENELDKYSELLSSDEYNFEADDWWEKMLSGASQQVGQWVRQLTDPETAALAIGSGGAALLAGQAGPQVLLPEEVLAVPAAFALGMKVCNAKTNMEIEGGRAYLEMLNNGVSEETARAIATGVGGVNAALDTLQLDELLKAYKILDKAGADDTLLDILVREVTNRTIDTAVETGQEVLQEGVTIGGTQLGSKIDTGEWAYSLGEVGDRLWDTAKESALTFGLTNIPSVVHNVGMQNHNRLVAAGEANILAGKMPTAEQLQAMNMSGAEALGMMAVFRMGEMDDAPDTSSVAPENQQSAGGGYTADDTLKNHIENGESTTSRRRGVRGAHVKDVFMENNILIVSATPHPQIPGVEIITYRMPKRDKTGAPISGEYQAGDPQRKTVYDPNVFSTSEYIRRGLEAANNTAQMFPDGILPGIWGGYDNDGVRWRGYYRDGKITSFYPE